MAVFGVQCLDHMQGTLVGLGQNFSIDMHVHNVSAHVENALYHTKRTSEIDAAASLLILCAREFARDHSGFALSAAEKNASSKSIERIQVAYQNLRSLIEAAEPSDVSLALGG